MCREIIKYCRIKGNGVIWSWVTVSFQLISLTYFHAILLNGPLLLFSQAPHWLIELLSGSLCLTVCMCHCSCLCMAWRSSTISPAALPFTPAFLCAPFLLFDPVPLSLPPSKPGLLSHRLSLPPVRPPRSLLCRRLSAPLSHTGAACGVNCHKACRGRLAVECRKRTKSISHEAPPTLQARSFSFPPPANTLPSLQNTGEV